MAPVAIRPPCDGGPVIGERSNRAFRRDPALFHNHETLRGTAREIDVLLDENDGDAKLTVDADDDLLDLLDDVGLNAFRRFVEQDELGLGQQRARDGELLLLPAGQVAAQPVEEFAQHGEEVEHLCDLAACRGSRARSSRSEFSRTVKRKDAPRPAARSRCRPRPLVVGARRSPRRRAGCCRSVRSISPRIVRSSVVLPTPLRPSTARNSPSPTLRETSCKPGDCGSRRERGSQAWNPPQPR